MAGKSTYLRQVALIAIMAQFGSFVPASEGDDWTYRSRADSNRRARRTRRGESTSVEMSETARLLRGCPSGACSCSTKSAAAPAPLDGLAIAWRSPSIWHDQTRAKVLFADHFHELTDLRASDRG